MNKLFVEFLPIYVIGIYNLFIVCTDDNYVSLIKVNK
jgi:hypothetical protein